MQAARKSTIHGYLLSLVAAIVVLALAVFLRWLLSGCTWPLEVHS